MRDKLLVSSYNNYILYKIRKEDENGELKETLYQVQSDGDASKYVVEIRFGWSDDYHEKDYNKITIAHGMRYCDDTIAETQEYINVLQEALDFIPRIKDAIFRDMEENE